MVEFKDEKGRQVAKQRSQSSSSEQIQRDPMTGCPEGQVSQQQHFDLQGQPFQVQE